eukprot:330982_1
MPCTNLVFAWQVGAGAPICLPPTIGFELKAESPWYLIDVHYDNPNGISGMKDNLGIQVTRFTKASVIDQGFQSASYLWLGLRWILSLFHQDAVRTKFPWNAPLTISPPQTSYA